MRLGTIALASRRSGKQHPKSTGATKSVGAAWLVTLWGSSSAAGTTAMAYSCATRSRASYQGVPAFAARLSSLRRSAMSAGSGRSWSGLGEETGTGGATNAPLGTTVVTPAMSLSRERPGSASRRANTEGSSLLLISSRGCWDWQEGCMGSRAGAGRGFSSGAGRRAFGPTCRRLIVAPSSSTSTGGGDGLVVFEAAELLKMGYRDLQKLAKENGVRANQTVEGMVKDLVGLGAKRGSIDDTDKDGAGFHKMSEEGLRSERGQGLSISAPPIDEVGDSSDDKNDLKLVRKSKTRASGVGKASGVRGKETASDMVRGLEKASAAAAAAAAAGVGDKGDGWVTIRLDGRGSDDSDALGVLEQEEEDYDEGDDSMEARLRDARASRDLSKVLMKANPEDYGFREDRITLDKLTVNRLDPNNMMHLVRYKIAVADQITVPKGCCPGCGSKFQSEDDTLPGYLREDKLEAFLARADEADAAADSVEGYAMTSEDVDMDPKMWQSLKQQQQQQQQQPQDSSDVAPPTELQPGGDVGGAQLKHPLLPLTDPRQCDAPDSSSSIGSDIEALPEGEKGTDEENDRLVVCQRCHRLRCYGSVEESLRPGFSDSDLLTPTRFLNAIDTRSRDLINSGLIRWRMTVLMDTVAESGREEWRRPELLGTLKKQRCLIIYLVDLFDFHGTFLYNLPKITGTNPVLVAGNKVDLLPKDLKKERVTKWVRDKCREAGLPAMEMRDVHLISSKHGVGIAPLMRKAREQALRGKRDIYVLGAANVGKSTFINYIIEDRGDNGGGLVSSRRSRGEGGKRSVPGRGVTVSSVPGTTLDFLKVDLGEKRALYDTPGLLMPHTLTSRLTAEELRAAIPKKKVDHVTFRLGEGKVVLLGGLSRVEVVEGRPFLLTFFVSNDVRLHPTDVTRVEGMLSSHVGKDKMIFPPFSSDRVQELGDLVPTDFDIVGAGWRESAADVVIAGLGWVSVTGAGPVTLRVWAPRGVLVMAREPLLPFESWETTATFTGGATVKKGKKKQGRRA